MQVVWCAVPDPRRIVDREREAGFPDFSGKPALLVEAAGQLFPHFRAGLDYAFILHRFRDEPDAGRVIRTTRSGSWGRLCRVSGSASP